MIFRNVRERDLPESGNKSGWVHVTDTMSESNQKAPAFAGASFLSGQRPTLPHTRACSTIGAEGLNFRVRDGNGWDPFARITQNCFKVLARCEYLTGSYPQGCKR